MIYRYGKNDQFYGKCRSFFMKIHKILAKKKGIIKA